MADAFDLIKVVAKQQLYGNVVMNVYHLAYLQLTPDFQVLEDIQENISDLHTYHGLMASDDLKFTTIEVINVTENETIGEVAYQSLTQGASATDALPNGVAGLVTFGTFVPKRRGRKFYAGISEGWCDNGFFVGNALTQLANMAVWLLSPHIGTLSGNTFVYGVQAGGLAALTNFTSSVVSNVPAYQRRRKIGVGI